MKLLYGTFIVFIIVQSSLYGSSKFLLNNGIIDIGHKQESSEIEIPKQRIINEPSMQITGNKLTYKKRIQSQKFDCENDFLGTETCPQQQSICQFVNEYNNGYSISHSVSKSFLKQCPLQTIMVGDKCYLDENNDGFKDYFFYIRKDEYKWENVYLNGTNSVERSGMVTVPARGHLGVRHHSRNACDNDSNFVVVKINNVIKLNESCIFVMPELDDYTSSYYTSTKPKDTGEVIVYTNDTDLDVSVSYFYSDAHSGRGHDHSNFLEFTYGVNQVISKSGFIEEVTGDNTYLYVDSTCPIDTIEKSDGSCVMEYDWYSYLCPPDVNFYNYQWQVIDGGFDCGNPTCTNSATPPANNCVRLNTVCPLNSNQKCGKTLNISGICDDGYVWNSNRCERIESYCGSSFYNSISDICQDITSYKKLCSNSNEVYNSVTNKCETAIDACLDGVYDREINKCVMNFIPECTTQGYTYNEDTDKCENKLAPLCENKYEYNGDTCKGEMTVCAIGFSYNDDLKKCEQDVCDILNTIDAGSRCETVPQCIGVFSGSECIPDVVQ